MLTHPQLDEAVGTLVGMARWAPGGALPIQDPSGRTVATLQFHDVPARPQDMPRHLRPKQKLSKRERDAAKREKLAAARA